VPFKEFFGVFARKGYRGYASYEAPNPQAWARPAEEVAREALAAWKTDYNTIRPHSAIGNIAPAAYAKLSAPAMQRDGALRYMGASAPRPVAPPSPMGSNANETLLIGG